MMLQKLDEWLGPITYKGDMVTCKIRRVLVGYFAGVAIGILTGAGIVAIMWGTSG